MSHACAFTTFACFCVYVVVKSWRTGTKHIRVLQTHTFLCTLPYMHVCQYMQYYRNGCMHICRHCKLYLINVPYFLAHWTVLNEVLTTASHNLYQLIGIYMSLSASNVSLIKHRCTNSNFLVLTGGLTLSATVGSLILLYQQTQTCFWYF